MRCLCCECAVLRKTSGIHAPNVPHHSSRECGVFVASCILQETHQKDLSIYTKWLEGRLQSCLISAGRKAHQMNRSRGSLANRPRYTWLDEDTDDASAFLLAVHDQTTSVRPFIQRNFISIGMVAAGTFS